eukprot:1353901-Rhodomonas_salina.3
MCEFGIPSPNRITCALWVRLTACCSSRSSSCFRPLHSHSFLATYISPVLPWSLMPIAVRCLGALHHINYFNTPVPDRSSIMMLHASAALFGGPERGRRKK